MLGLSACAGGAVPWENPAVPKSEWSRDWTACRRWAEDQIGYQENTSSSPLRDYDRSRAKRQADAMAGVCMQDRGYVPARSKK
jgi:hypothetical protein